MKYTNLSVIYREILEYVFVEYTQVDYTISVSSLPSQ